MNRLSPLRKLSLAGEILGAYARIRWLMLRRHELPSTVALLRAAPRRPPSPPLPDGPGQGERLGRAVVRTLSLLPTDSRCLMRSLVLLRLLARRGSEASLVIAVQPTAERQLNAHAWVELDGRPLLAPATPEYGRLVTL